MFSRKGTHIQIYIQTDKQLQLCVNWITESLVKKSPGNKTQTGEIC